MTAPNAPSRELPSAWIEKLFARFQAIYGNRFATMFGDADPTEVKATWSSELGGFEADDLRHALDTMRTAHQDFPPTLFEFRALCRDSRIRRAQSVPKIEAPPVPMPEHVKAELERFMRGKTILRGRRS